MVCGNCLVAAACLYGMFALLAARTRTQRSRTALSNLPQVTLLKPLCGAEPETYDCLRSFCDQTHQDFQIIFGIADPDDRVIAVVQRLQREFPELDMLIAVDRSQHGSNRKISNLINMVSQAKHDYFVLADCDVRVQRDYLANVTAPLCDPSVGIVTCPYRGVARRGGWSQLGCMFINEWFMPSVQIAARCGSRAFAFGATIALRRQVLNQIGGLTTIANHLADDYRLGELTRALGLRTVLSEIEVEVVVVEDSLKKLVQHELRWLRTIRAVRPLSYVLCFITFGLPVAILGVSLSGGGSVALGLLGVTIAARVLLHLKSGQPGSPYGHMALVPLRDFLSFGLWFWSFTTRGVWWRDKHYRVFRDGSALPIVRT